MRWNGFSSSLVFAAAAALLFPAFALLAQSVFSLSASSAVSLYLVLAAAVYLAGLGPQRARGFVVGGVAGLLGLVVLILAQDTAEVAIGAALIVGVGRSALLYRRRVARSIATEVLLIGGGLALARFLATPSLAGFALGLWGFLLVQSVHFLVGGVRARNTEAGNLDPFDLARSRALTLLEEE